MSAVTQHSKITPDDIAQHLETLLSIPIAVDNITTPPTISYSLANDASTLTCGCIISESLASSLKSNNKKDKENTKELDTGKMNVFTCPVCKTPNITVLSPCTNMRNLYLYLIKLKEELSTRSSSIDNSSLPLGIYLNPTDNSSSLLSHEKANDKDSIFNEDDLPSMFSKLNTESNLNTNKFTSSQPMNLEEGSSQNNLSFLTAFHEVLVEIQNPSSSIESNEISKSPTYSSKYSPRDQYLGENTPHSFNSHTNFTGHSPTNASVISSLGSIQRQRTRQSSFPNASNLTKLMSSNSTYNNNNTSATANTNTSNNSPKSQPNKEMLLSKNFPFFRRIYTYNTHNNNFLLKTKLYLQTQLSPKLTKLVLLSEKKWEVYTIDTERPDKAPKLLCCGKSDASYGPDNDHLKKTTHEQIISNSNIADNVNEALNLLDSWEHLYCQITENLLFISGTRGFFRIFDLTQNGRCLYTYQCNFPIRCFDVSPNEEFIALGITGKDKYTQVEQAVIIILKIIPPTSKFLFQVLTYPFSLPYRDPISILRFSPDSSLLSVATALESRFLVISITDPARPTLVMKSQRRLDTSLDSEGITDMSFFPDNRFMTVTSLSVNSEPIIIDTNISSISGPDGIAKPKLLMKIDEVGSTIHKCCVSPRGDSVAYLNRNGNVYIMTTPRMDDNDNKKISCVLEVANAFRAKEAASLRFDPDGYKLYVLDRKGILSIADFTAGTVEDHSVTRCKIIA